MASPATKLPYPPLNFDREHALAYTGWAPKFFEMLISTGRLKGQPLGRNGSLLYARERLEEINRALGGEIPANDIDGEFEALGRN